MANLDLLYDNWFRSSTVQEQRDTHAALLDGIRRHAKRILNDDDLTSDVLLVIIQKIERFVRAAEDSFGHWVNTIIRRTRAAGFKAMSTQAERQTDIDPDIICLHDEPFVDFTEVPDDLKPVAELMIQGYTLRETSTLLGTSYNALRQKLWRHRVTKHPAQSINR